MIITLKRDAACADCGAELKAGQTANWYRNGAVYGLTCHEKPAGRRSRRGLNRTAYERGDRSPGAIASHYDRAGIYTPDGQRIGGSCNCEDRPCCGC